MLYFTKMNGAGNDFVLIDNRSGDVHLNRDQIVRICDRHRGVGADGILLLEKSSNQADFRTRYFNSDGGEAEMCRNGARCFARIRDKIAGRFSEVRVETMAGVIQATFEGEFVKLEMSRPHPMVLSRALESGGLNRLSHS